ncbi:MAG: 50S ribosomal protein L9 [Armatimonadetes bacterium]|nr:50S ribosomal protein L9 [Armatimonadota bacterium]
MEVILTKNVDHLGQRGSIVRVADGYGRNYLLPKGMAILATKGARKQAEDMQRSEQRREQQRRDGAMTERDRLHGKAVTVRARATAQGKLYGSVTPKDVCDALHDTHGVVADADKCRMEEHIRQTGQFTVHFHVYKDIMADVTVTVKAVEGEGAEAEAQAAEEVQRAPKPKPVIGGDAG